MEEDQVRTEEEILEEIRKLEEQIRGPYAYKSYLGQVLDGVDFSGKNLTGSNFKNAKITNCNFNDALLHYCNFRDAVIENTTFVGAKASMSVGLSKEITDIDFDTPPPNEEEIRLLYEELHRIKTDS